MDLITKKMSGTCLSCPRYSVSLPCGQPYWNKLCHHIEQLRGLQPTEVDKLEQILRGIQHVTEEELTHKPQYPLPSAGGEFYFGGLIHFLKHDASVGERETFFGRILPTVVTLAVEIEQWKPNEMLHYCSQQQDGHTQISRRFAACLLAHSFLCTLPPQTSVDLNQINFRFFFKHLENLSLQKAQAAKLRCILNYFRRLSEDQPSGNLVITRKVFPQELMPSLDTWETSDASLCAYIVKQEGAIESVGSEIVQVDFANRYVGGGVLSSGLVQEEIRFITCPELIACLTFIECMQDNEAVQISGFEQYSCYSGYSHSFSFDGDYRDDAKVDSLGNLETTLLAIDASEFYDTSDDQYRENYLLRDLNKAFIGFLPSLENDDESSGGSDDEFSFHTVGTEKSRLTAETDFETASEGFEITTVEQGSSYDLGCITNYGNALSKAITHIAVKDASILQSGESHDYTIGEDWGQLENLIDSERGEYAAVGADWMLLTENSYLSRELKNFCEKLTEDVIISVFSDNTLKHNDSTQEQGDTNNISEEVGPDGSGDHSHQLSSQQKLQGTQGNLKCLVNGLVSSAVNEALQEKHSQPSPTENSSVHSGVSSSVGDFSIISSISGHSDTFVKVGKNGECNDLVPPGGRREDMVEKYVSEVIGQAVSVVKRLDNIEEERHLSASSDRPSRSWRGRRQGNPPAEGMDDDRDNRMRGLESAWNDAGVRSHLLHNLEVRDSARAGDSAVGGVSYGGRGDDDNRPARELPLQGPVVNIEDPDAATPGTPPPFPSFRQSEQSSHSNFSEADLLIFGEELLNLPGDENDRIPQNHVRTERAETFSDEFDDYMDDEDSELDHMFAAASRRSSSRSGSASSKPPILDSFTEGLLKIANIDPQGRRPSRTEESLQYFSAELAKRAERDRYNLRRESDLDRFTFDLFHVMGVPRTTEERKDVKEEVAVTCGSRLAADIMQDVAIQMFGTVFPHSVRLIPAKEGDFPPRREPSEVDILSLAANLANTILESAMHNNQREGVVGGLLDGDNDTSESIPEELESDMDSHFAQIDENSVCESTATEDIPPFKLGTKDMHYSSVDELAWNISSIIVSDALGEVRKVKLLQNLYERSIRVEQRPLATGNWGCGVFGGDPQVKALIQWMAASQAGVRTVYYHSFDDERVEELPEVVQLLRMRGWSVGQTAGFVRNYCEKRLAAVDDLPDQDLFREILGLKLVT